MNLLNSIFYVILGDNVDTIKRRWVSISNGRAARAQVDTISTRRRPPITGPSGNEGIVQAVQRIVKQLS